MPTTFKPSRRTRPEAYNFESGRDAAHYEPNGRKFRLTLWPALDSAFPTVTIDAITPDGQAAPPVLPFTRISRAWIETAGEVRAVVAGLYSTTGQMLAFAFTAGGEMVAAGAYPGDEGEETVMQYLAAKIDFDRNARPLDKSALKTEILPVDEVAMLHNWQAQILTRPAYTVAGQVPELRKAGHRPDKNFSFWKSGHVWQHGGFTHIVAEDVNGKTHVVTNDKDGNRITATTFSNFAAALAGASQNAQITEQANARNAA